MFHKLALKTFRHQFEYNPVYQQFCKLLNKTPDNVKTLEDIPFLPISFFKEQAILTGDEAFEKIFCSSGTTGQMTSKHFVKDLSLYEQSFRLGFQTFYGNPSDYCILALLPTYLEREDSSLVYMFQHLIEQSEHPDSGFYLNNYADLAEKLKTLETKQQPTILIGVSFALCDLVEQFNLKLQHTIVMETGGMKGKRPEMTKPELHQKLKAGFGVNSIHSEYGMTELLSQAYSFGDNIFETPPWMKVMIRDLHDPLTIVNARKTGGINVIDLANQHSCAFIATEDLGKTDENERFEVLGRVHASDVRGCNLMIQ